MKELIEKYKKKVQNIEEFLSECGIRPTNAAIRTRERANCYRIFIAELEAIEKEAKQ